MASFLDELGNSTANLMSNVDFIKRTVGMPNSYEGIMFIVQSLGHEPVSLLGKDYLYIFDHVRRNYDAGSNIVGKYGNDCPKFTFYKEKPTVRFANPYEDADNLLDKWIPNMDFESTSQRNILFSYAESDDEYTNNKEIGTTYDIDNANPGVNFGGISSFSNVMATCDMIKKTNDNFNHGKYKTLVARFHTNSDDSKSKDDITQTAVSEQYGMSHGRNLLKRNQGDSSNGYDNPYCRVWTYHHQYNQLARAIRPFGDVDSEVELESNEQIGDYNTVGFRTVEDKTFGFKGGSERLDKYGVLNYKNGMVNIAPTAKIKDYFEHKEDKEISIKKCMFSIENLAWKSENVRMDEYDQYGLSPEQKGPLGGRIMWFPPYDLTFSEDVRVNWNSNQFIGRGEKVYTYTDTERTGNLSFTLLIDHPSILDYWTGHERNGMQNQGMNLIPGNGGGVDEVNNQENTLLRFFAGCEILSAKPQEFRTRVRKRETTADPEKPKVPDKETIKPSGKKTIYCFAFYPNNYSGADDYPNTSNKVNAIHYLLNGIGTQRRFNTTTKKGEDFAVEMDKTLTLQKIIGSEGQPLEEYGGYEMKIDKGVSIATNILKDKASIDKTYEGATQNVQFLTDESGNKYMASYGDGKNNLLTKYSSNKALPQSSAVLRNGKINDNWYDCRYYYRVDSNTLSQKLVSSISYIDTTSYGFNSFGIYRMNETLKNEFGIDFVDNDDIELISLEDMYYALEGNTSNISYTTNSAIETIRKLKDAKDGYKISKIRIVGNASSQGKNRSEKVNENRNNRLSEKRGETLKNWLIKNNFSSIETAKVEPSNNIQKGGNKDDVNDPITKLWRSAYVEIEYEVSDVENAATAENVKANENGQIDKDRVEIKNKEQSNGALDTKTASKPTSWISAFNNPKVNAIANTVYNDTVGNKNDIIEDISSDTTDEEDSNVIEINTGIVERYDNEGEFFELLEKNDPFLHHLISEKIRYFDPAFHSVSPEGFNARLTFLHQCTRQGSTVGGADNQMGTAYNLAFGRPPICVLRLGDFYYTKIVINTVSIQYESPQWDLNPEGIGVMPMFAKITIGFAFLGGSDLAGPISRLQNAVSFNYYANTSVYDNRAEMVQYDSDGNGREVKFKPYSYPDMLYTNGEPKKVKKKVPSGVKEVATNDYGINSGGLEDFKEKIGNEKPVIKRPISTTQSLPEIFGTTNIR